MKVTHTTPEIACFNAAVEHADRLTNYRYDRVGPGALFASLLHCGLTIAAQELVKAGAPLGYFQKQTEFAGRTAA